MNEDKSNAEWWVKRSTAHIDLASASVIIILDSLYDTRVHSIEENAIINLCKYLGNKLGLKFNNPDIIQPKVKVIMYSCSFSFFFRWSNRQMAMIVAYTQFTLWDCGCRMQTTWWKRFRWILSNLSSYTPFHLQKAGIWIWCRHW
jgi:hypothetical protein